MKNRQNKKRAQLVNKCVVCNKKPVNPLKRGEVRVCKKHAQSFYDTLLDFANKSSSVNIVKLILYDLSDEQYLDFVKKAFESKEQ